MTVIAVYNRFVHKQEARHSREYKENENSLGGGLLHVRRVNRADMAGIQEFVIHRDEDP